MRQENGCLSHAASSAATSPKAKTSRSTWVVVVAAWTALVTMIVAVLVARFFPMRVDEETEHSGLDITSHGERAWEMD